MVTRSETPRQLQKPKNQNASTENYRNMKNSPKRPQKAKAQQILSNITGGALMGVLLTRTQRYVQAPVLFTLACFQNLGIVKIC